MALSDIVRLHEIAKKPSRLIIGLMSGTSLDGLDIALCRLEGSGPSTKATVLHFKTNVYDLALKAQIMEVFAKPYASLELVCSLNARLALIHAAMVLVALQEWNISPGEIDCIASHGQTIYHSPGKDQHSTLQIADGDIIAVKTGIITLSDFRQKHIAAGGEGAPLALYGDHLLFSSATENRILLNIGGISNFTFLPAGGGTTAILSTDTGPGNTLIDACVRRDFGEEMDRDAGIAKTGSVNEMLLNTLLSHTFFSAALPKTTGPELFNMEFTAEAQRQSGTLYIPPNDLLATLVQFTAETIAHAIASLNCSDTVVYVSGGGTHNPLLMQALKLLLPGMPLRNFDELGVSPDAKEALLFAVLANETIAGSAIKFTGAPSITMGKISLPL